MRVYVVFCQYDDDFYDIPSAKAFLDRKKAQHYLDLCTIGDDAEAWDGFIEELEVVE